MKIIYKDGTVAECPQEEELHVLRHTAAHIMAHQAPLPAGGLCLRPCHRERLLL